MKTNPILSIMAEVTLLLVTLALLVNPSIGQTCKCYNFCPSGWESHGDSCYKYGASPLSGSDAETECEDLGGYLSSISSQEEQDYVYSYWQDRVPDESQIPAPLTSQPDTEISLTDKPASQSSTHDETRSTAEKAIDGVTTGDYWQNSCTHTTGGEMSPWWMVDMESNQCVGKIELYNRADCCAFRLDGAIVRVGPNADRSNPACAIVTMEQTATGQMIEVSCGISGRYLSVHLPNTYPLTLCEVKAYTGSCSSDGTAQIVLNGQPTSQSSIHDPTRSTSEKAVDGNTNGDYFQDSCMHTSFENDASPWWMVDIGQSRCVGRVAIFNRAECCSERLAGAVVRVGDDPFRVNPACGIITLEQINANQKVDVNCNLRGRYLSIELPSGMLNVCEVQSLVGTNCEDVGGIPLIGQPASQSSTHDESRSTADKAVDGNTDGDYFQDSCIHTVEQTSPWWMVDIGETQCVGKVEIFNRDECCAELLEGAIIRVGSDSNRDNQVCGNTITLGQINANQKIEATCDLQGRYLSIDIPGENNILHVCEVRAMKGQCPGSIEIPLIDKDTSQSSTRGYQIPPTSDKAVDGITSGLFTDRSCMHTNDDPSPWWKVDLGESRCVGRVEIYNRDDGSIERLVGAIVRVGPNSDRSNPACGTISLEQINANQKVEEMCDLHGQYLSIEIPTTQFLHVCEVRAFVGQCQDSNTDKTNSLWIGGKNTGGPLSWKWMDDTVVKYTNWERTYDKHDYNQSCIHMWNRSGVEPAGGWNGVLCDSSTFKFPYVCERSGHSVCFPFEVDLPENQ